MKSLLMTAENGSKIHNKAKTMTRRLQGLEKVNEKPDEWEFIELKTSLGYPASEGKTWAVFKHSSYKPDESGVCFKAKFSVGDIVSIREPALLWGYWQTICIDGKKRQSFMRVSRIGNEVYYPDNPPEKTYTGREYEIGYHFRPGMFMFERHVRSHVRITEVICQRLQEISEKDCKAEGVIYPLYRSESGVNFIWDEKGYSRAFAALWDSINPKMPMKFNPWVFGYRMELVEVK